MKKLIRYNPDTGQYIGDEIFQEIPDPLPGNLTNILPPDGLYDGRFVDGEWVEMGTPPEIQQSPDYPKFRVAIALLPAYERIMDAVAIVSVTKHTNLSSAWLQVRDTESLGTAVKFWNVIAVPIAAPTPEESAAIGDVALKYGVLIAVASNGVVNLV